MGQASSPKLTPTQAKLVKAKIKAEITNKSQNEVAQTVYPNATPASAGVMMSRELKKVNVQEALQIAMFNAGLTAEALANVVGDGMKANRVVQVEGDFYETEVPDHGIRLKAAGMAANWMGVGKDTDGATNINFINIAASQKDNYTFS